MRSDDQIASLLYPHLTNRKAAVAVANPTATRAEIEKKLAQEPDPQLEEEVDTEFRRPEPPVRRPAGIVDAIPPEAWKLIEDNIARMEAEERAAEERRLRRDHEEAKAERARREAVWEAKRRADQAVKDL